MNIDLYKLFNLKFKKKEDIPEDWNVLVDDVDDFIKSFLEAYGIDMDFLFTTNVGLLNINSNNECVILWDLSYWAIYIKYLEFIFWMENEQKQIKCKTSYPHSMKENIFTNKDKYDANRLVFLSTIFEYASYKFYNEDDLSYCFALLYNQNKCLMPHELSYEENEAYVEYIHEQLIAVKLFCAFHEAYHLKKIKQPGDYKEYNERIMYNVKSLVNGEEFGELYSYDKCLLDDVRKRVNSMNEQDHLVDELYSDAAALDLLDIVLNNMDVLQPKWSLNKYSQVVKEMIENFYSFNTLTYDLYTAWDATLSLIKGKNNRRCV